MTAARKTKPIEHRDGYGDGDGDEGEWEVEEERYILLEMGSNQTIKDLKEAIARYREEQQLMGEEGVTLARPSIIIEGMNSSVTPKVRIVGSSSSTSFTANAHGVIGTPLILEKDSCNFVASIDRILKLKLSTTQTGI